MKRWKTWTVVALALVALGVGVARALKARQQASAVAAVPVSAPAYELGSSDLWVVRPTLLTRTLAVSGGLRAAVSAVVKARVAADVQSLTVREGDTVKAGQVIGRLDTTEFALRIRQAEQSALSARTQLDIARRTLENNRALVAQGFISATGLETSASAEAGAQATYQAALAATELARKSQADALLVAPINGVVSQRLAQPGERVGVDAKVVEIVDLGSLELEAAVAPEDVGAVQVGQTARLVLDGLAEPATARVVRINPSTQAGTRAVMVYLAVQPQRGLRQGLFARGSIELARKTALAVPVSAVRVDQTRPYLLVVEAGKVQQRAVTLGERGEASFEGSLVAAVEIAAGAAEGTVLLRGTTGALRDGTVVAVAVVAVVPGTASASAGAAASAASAGASGGAPAATSGSAPGAGAASTPAGR